MHSLSYDAALGTHCAMRRKKRQGNQEVIILKIGNVKMIHLEKRKLLLNKIKKAEKSGYLLLLIFSSNSCLWAGYLCIKKKTKNFAQIFEYISLLFLFRLMNIVIAGMAEWLGRLILDRKFVGSSRIPGKKAKGITRCGHIERKDQCWWHTA